MTTNVLTTTQTAVLSVIQEDGQPIALIPVAGTTPGLGTTAVFVFQPGGVAGANVYTDWPSLMAAVGAVAGVKTVEIDATIAAAQVPAGTWNVDGVEFRNRQTANAGTTLLTFLQGAVFAFEELRINGLLQFVNTSTNPVVVSTTGVVIRCQFSGSIVCNAGAAPFFQVSGGTNVLFLTNQGFIGDSTHAVVTVDAGQNLVVSIPADGGANAGSIVGAGSILAVLSSDSQFQAQTVTTQNLLIRSDAKRESYTAAVVANWSGTNPTSVANALDRIAAKITPIP